MTNDYVSKFPKLWSQIVNSTYLLTIDNRFLIQTELVELVLPVIENSASIALCSEQQIFKPEERQEQLDVDG